MLRTISSYYLMLFSVYYLDIVSILTTGFSFNVDSLVTTGSSLALVKVIIFLLEELGLRLLFIVMHCFGQTLTHSLQIMHLKVSNSQVLVALVTFMASAGHFLAHMLQ